MSNTRPLTTLTTDKPGRPRSIRKRAESLIGTAGVSALYDADLFLISGSLARELALIVEPPAASAETTTQTSATTTA